MVRAAPALETWLVRREGFERAAVGRMAKPGVGQMRIGRPAAAAIGGTEGGASVMMARRKPKMEWAVRPGGVYS